MSIDIIISVISKSLIIIGLYFSILWTLLLLNVKSKERRFITEDYPDITIIIPAYNEQGSIKATIESVLMTKYKGKVNVLLVNDGSTDNTLKIAESYKDKIRILDLKKNQGKAGALNLGLKKVLTPYFAVIDADTKIASDTILKAIQCFESHSKKDEIGAVVCRMKPYNRMVNILERIQLLEYTITGLIRYLAAQNQILDMTNGGTFYKTDVVKKIGGFDKNNLTEDFEMGVKIKKSSHLILYSQYSKVFTKNPSTINILLKQRIRWARGFIQTHSKHKKIFFNRKYGFYGLYQFPMNVIGPLLYFISITLISFKVYKKIYEFVFKLIYTPDVIEWFYFGTIKDYLLGLDPQIDILIGIGFLLVMGYYYAANKFYEYNYFKKDTLKKVIAFIIYIMVYNYMYIYIWIKSFYLEFKKSKYDWGTK